jgi:hypothetical protein
MFFLFYFSYGIIENEKMAEIDFNENLFLKIEAYRTKIN